MHRYLLIALLAACTPKTETAAAKPPAPAPEAEEQPKDERPWAREDERPCRFAEKKAGASKTPSLMVMAPGVPFEVTLDGEKLICDDAEAEAIAVEAGKHDLRLTGPDTEAIEHSLEAKPEDDNRLIQFP